MSFSRKKCGHNWREIDQKDSRLMRRRICNWCGHWQWLLPPTVAGGTQSKWDWIPNSVLDAESTPPKTEFDLWSENFPTTA